MKRSHASNPTTPIIAPALRRRASARPRRALHKAGGGRGVEKYENNYVAISQLSPCAASQTRNRPGARRGNRNAQKHGTQTAVARARRRRWRALYKELDAILIGLEIAVKSGADPRPSERALEALMQEACTL
ncbi:MAG: hypothetical protein JO167_15380 [Alphaproteobacteria bacterium]|nr:hypothetical protein [Alphaproteobacteria bacterium]